MLSVQTAGYAGMERLGVPTRTTLNSPPDDRGQYSCRMRVETLPAREILVRSETVIRNSNNTSNSSSSSCLISATINGSSGSKISKKQPQQQQQQQQHQRQQLVQQEHHNQHSHQQHQQHHHHHYHKHQQQQPQQQHYQRMSQQQQPEQFERCDNGNENECGNQSISNNNSSSGNCMRGGIEASTLKYGNMGSGSGGGCGGSGYSSSSISCSSCNCNSHSIDHHQHYQQSGQGQLKPQRIPYCPHHVPLPDSEWGQDRNMQIRASYQQSEITRSYIKPPPNRSIKDLPDNYNALSALGGSNMMLYGAPPNAVAPHPLHQQQQPQPPPQPTTKSKPNVITKLFSRKSSTPKSPTMLANTSPSTSATALATSASITSMPASTTSSASSLASAVMQHTSTISPTASISSSASSLASAPLTSMPISTAAMLKTTACNYGASSLQTSAAQLPSIPAGLAPSTQLLTTIGVSPAVTPSIMERIPTPPLSVTVPIGGYHQQLQQLQQQQQQQQQRLYQQQQQMLLDNIVAESATPTTLLQTLKSSSCSLSSTSGAAERNSNRNSLLTMDCYPLTPGTPRSRTPNTMASDENNCNCNSRDCKMCYPNKTT